MSLALKRICQEERLTVGDEHPRTINFTSNQGYSRPSVRLSHSCGAKYHPAGRRGAAAAAEPSKCRLSVGPRRRPPWAAMVE